MESLASDVQLKIGLFNLLWYRNIISAFISIYR